MTADDIIWRPRPEVAARSRIGTFLRVQAIATLSELQRRSVADPEWYWTKVVEDLGIRWLRAPRRVLDDARGPAWPVWFPGGLMNLTDCCVARHVEGGRAANPAVIWEGDDGSPRQVTYGELLGEVSCLANALRALGVGEGDRVGIFLPMSLEAAIATLAVVRIGAIYTPCFSGFGAQAVASRLQDSEAKVLITADGFHRRGQVVRMKETADEALALSPTVKAVLVNRRLGRDIPWTAGRDRWWHEAVATVSQTCPVVPVDADRPCLIIYTSGTTGRPKGTVLTHGGFLIKCAHDFAYCMDVGRDDRLFWLTDLGWLMGPMAITAALVHGATGVVFEGVPDFPKPDRLWGLVERHRITVMGLSPTAVRAHGAHPGNGGRRLRRRRPPRARSGWRAGGDEAVARHDARLLARSGALRGDLLVALAGRVGPRRLGRDRRRRLLVPPGPFGRHVEDRRQAPGARRGRVHPGRSPRGGRGRSHRRAARGEGRGGGVLRRAQTGTPAVRPVTCRAFRAGGPRDGQGPQARARAVRARPAQDALGEDHAPRDPRDLSEEGAGGSLVARKSRRRQGDRRGELMGATLVKSLAMLLVLAILAVSYGCAGFSSSDSSAFPVSLRQAVCERDGGVWRANGRCEIQSTAR